MFLGQEFCVMVTLTAFGDLVGIDRIWFDVDLGMLASLFIRVIVLAATPGDVNEQT